MARGKPKQKSSPSHSANPQPGYPRGHRQGPRPACNGDGTGVRCVHRGSPAARPVGEHRGPPVCNLLITAPVEPGLVPQMKGRMPPGTAKHPAPVDLAGRGEHHRAKVRWKRNPREEPRPGLEQNTQGRLFFPKRASAVAQSTPVRNRRRFQRAGQAEATARRFVAAPTARHWSVPVPDCGVASFSRTKNSIIRASCAAHPRKSKPPPPCVVFHRVFAYFCSGSFARFSFRRN